MKVKEKISIGASPEQVWKFIEDPNNLSIWNPKVKMVTAFDSTRHVGYSFGIMYEMSGRAMEYRAEITTFEYASHLVFTFSGGSLPMPNSVTEEFIITPLETGSLLQRNVDFGRANMPWWAKILFWLIFTFGKPVGDTYLMDVKRIIEHGEK